MTLGLLAAMLILAAVLMYVRYRWDSNKTLPRFYFTVEATNLCVTFTIRDPQEGLHTGLFDAVRLEIESGSDEEVLETSFHSFWNGKARFWEISVLSVSGIASVDRLTATTVNTFEKQGYILVHGTDVPGS